MLSRKKVGVQEKKKEQDVCHPNKSANFRSLNKFNKFWAYIDSLNKNGLHDCQENEHPKYIPELDTYCCSSDVVTNQERLDHVESLLTMIHDEFSDYMLENSLTTQITHLIQYRNELLSLNRSFIMKGCCWGFGSKKVSTPDRLVSMLTFNVKNWFASLEATFLSENPHLPKSVVSDLEVQHLYKTLNEEDRSSIALSKQNGKANEDMASGESARNMIKRRLSETLNDNSHIQHRNQIKRDIASIIERELDQLEEATEEEMKKIVERYYLHHINAELSLEKERFAKQVEPLEEKEADPLVEVEPAPSLPRIRERVTNFFHNVYSALSSYSEEIGERFITLIDNTIGEWEGGSMKLYKKEKKRKKASKNKKTKKRFIKVKRVTRKKHNYHKRK